MSADELLNAAQQLCIRARLSATRVLAVDDDPAVLELMRTLLQSHDLDVHTLSDPLRARVRGRRRRLSGQADRRP